MVRNMMKRTITATGTRRERALRVSKSIASTPTNLWWPTPLSRSARPGQASLLTRMSREWIVRSRKDATHSTPSPPGLTQDRKELRTAKRQHLCHSGANMRLLLDKR